MDDDDKKPDGIADDQSGADDKKPDESGDDKKPNDKKPEDGNDAGKKDDGEKTVEELEKELADAQKHVTDKTDQLAKLRTASNNDKKELGELKKQVGELESLIKDGYKNEALATLAGTDKELREKILVAYGKINSPETTKDEIMQKMSDAYNMLGIRTKANPLTAALNQGGDDAKPKNDKGFAETDEGKGLAQNLGINITSEDKK